MADIGFLEIDPESGDARRLLQSVGAHHGDLVRVADHLQRLFLFRSPWAPGLRFFGALAKSRKGGAPTGDPKPFSLGGCGTTLEAALTSCLGEAVERLSQVEGRGDVAVAASWETVREQIPPPAVPMISRLLEQSAYAGEPLDWVKARSLAGADCLLPADWCLRRANDAALAVPGAALSTGCAAGASVESAATRALLELIERDAAALWWIGGRPPRPMPFGDPAHADPEKLLHTLRDGTTERTTRLLDITTDLRIPTVAAISFDRRGRNFVAGLASRLDTGEASMAALIELCQMEVGLQLALLKQRQLGPQTLTADDRRHLERAAGVQADDPRFQPARTGAAPAAGRGPGPVERAFAEAGIDAYLVDLTRSGLRVPVVKAVAPELQLLPCDLLTSRLMRNAVDDPSTFPSLPLV